MLNQKLKMFTLCASIIFISACANKTPDNMEGKSQPAAQAATPAPSIASAFAQNEIAPAAAVYEAKNTVRMENDLYISSATAHQSVMHASTGGVIRSVGANIVKSGDSKDELQSGQSGLNAAVLAEASGNIELEDSMISTSAVGGSGAFARGTGSTVTMLYGNVNTGGDSSPAIAATDGGHVNSDQLVVSTSGDGSPGISAGAGGLADLRGGQLTTGGTGSPAVLTSGKVRIDGSALRAEAAEGAVINGAGSLTLIDTQLCGNAGNGIAIYRSGSDDAGGMAAFGMTGGSLTSLEGSLFHVSNSSARITLNAVALDAGSGVLLTAAAGEQGKYGLNGGHVTLNTRQQTLTGCILADRISTMALTMESNSTFTGAVNADNQALLMDVSLDKTSVWDLTGDSYVSAFADDDKSFTNISDNGNNIFYEADNEANAWLGGKTYVLQHGGSLQPKK